MYYTDTDSYYIEKKYWDVMDKAGLVGDDLCQVKDEYKSRGIFHSSLLAPKVNYCLTMDNFGIIQQHMTFKVFNDSKRLLDRSQKFKLLRVERVTIILAKSWKKSFNNVITSAVKMRRCVECKGEKLCMTRNNEVNEKKIEINLNFLRRRAPNQFCHVLPYYKSKVIKRKVIRYIKQLPNSI